MKLNELAAEIHAQNAAAGWWDTKQFPKKLDRYETAMMLVITELAEAAEGARKNLPDDKLPHHPMLHVELADAAIRLLDLAGAYDVELDGVFFEDERAWSNLNMHRSCNDLTRLFLICTVACNQNLSKIARVRDALAAIFAMSQVIGIGNNGLLAIIDEKRAFNATRADHKPENRAKEHGKKF